MQIRQVRDPTGNVSRHNGGAVFDLSRKSVVADADSGETQKDGSAAPSNSAPPPVAGTSAAGSTLDAAELATRGSMLAARRDFAPALADLTKAIEMSPEEPEYYFQRANTYWANGQADLALADFDHVISLKRDFLPAYIPRAQSTYGRRTNPPPFRILTPSIIWRPSQRICDSHWGRFMRRSIIFPLQSSNTDCGSTIIPMIRAWPRR
jgi:tetratricopeptide (TPR) repeat protein